MAVGKSVSQEFVKLNLDQFAEELKTNCIWLKLLVVELPVFHGLFDERKEQNGTRHFFKARVEKKASKKTPVSLSKNSLFCLEFV